MSASGGGTSSGGSGDITAVGDCSTGACFGGASGTTLTSTTSEILDLGTDATLIFQRNNSGSVTFMGKDDAGAADTIYDTTGAGAIQIGSADVTSVTIVTDGSGTGELVLPLQSVAGAEIVNDTLTPTQIDETQDYSFTTLSGKIDRNNTAVDDDDCTGEQGKWWYDTTDSQFEFCNANAGAPATVGAAGSGDITDVFNCSTGDCSSIALADGDLLDASGVTVNTTTEGILLPTFNSGGTANGQISYDATNDILYVGTGTNAAAINVLPMAASGPGTAASRFIAVYSSLTPSATETDVNNYRTQRSCIMQNLHCTIDVDPGGVGRSWDCTVDDDAAGTTLTCNIANGTTECNDTTHRPTVAIDSKIAVSMVRNSTAASPGNMVANWECVPN